MAAAAAVIGALGTIGSLAQGAMGSGVSSISTLNPVQQMMQFQQIAELSKYMGGNVNLLNQLGQNTPNAYSSLNSFNKDYKNNIMAGSMARTKTNMASLMDRAHKSNSQKLINRFRTENTLNTNSLKQNLLQQDADIKQAATENMWGRQYKALGGMSGLFGAVNGQSRENWVRNNPTGMEMGVAGLTGISSLGRAAGTIFDELRMSGIGSGSSSGVSGGFGGNTVGGGFS